jgi:hypothetical protein
MHAGGVDVLPGPARRRRAAPAGATSTCCPARRDVDVPPGRRDVDVLPGPGAAAPLG